MKRNRFQPGTVLVVDAQPEEDDSGDQKRSSQAGG